MKFCSCPEVISVRSEMHEIFASGIRSSESPMTRAMECGYAKACEKVNFEAEQSKQLIFYMVNTATTEGKTSSKEMKSNIDNVGKIIITKF